MKAQSKNKIFLILSSHMKKIMYKLSFSADNFQTTLYCTVRLIKISFVVNYISGLGFFGTKLVLLTGPFNFPDFDIRAPHPCRGRPPPLCVCPAPHPWGGMYRQHAPPASSVCGLRTAVPCLVAHQAQSVEKVTLIYWFHTFKLKTGTKHISLNLLSSFIKKSLNI